MYNNKKTLQTRNHASFPPPEEKEAQVINAISKSNGWGPFCRDTLLCRGVFQIPLPIVKLLVLG
jgi:hypothetical protein